MSGHARPGQRARSCLEVARRLLAGGIAAAAAMLVTLSHYSVGWRTCSTDVVGDRLTVNCGAYPVNDLAPDLVLVALLLLPDLYEIAVPGIGTLRMRARAGGERGAPRQNGSAQSSGCAPPSKSMSLDTARLRSRSTYGHLRHRSLLVVGRGRARLVRPSLVFDSATSDGGLTFRTPVEDRATSIGVATHAARRPARALQDRADESEGLAKYAPGQRSGRYSSRVERER
jgi:hypothetical protein